MAVRLIDSPDLPATGLYRHAAVGTGSRTVFLAGQVAWDAEGTTVGDDLASQLEQVYANVGSALAAAGATFDDVVKLTCYVVDWHPDKMPELVDGMRRGAARLSTEAIPPASLIGVAALDVPEHLVEIEAVAVLD